MNNTVFIATPISGFDTHEEYFEYRKKVLNLVCFLRSEGYDVCTEIESITDADNYDSPGSSVKEDFESIRDAGCFILLHPKRMQTSSLIEFGYACAMDKDIIIVGERVNLPYLMVGYSEYWPRATILEATSLDMEVFQKIVTIINSSVNRESSSSVLNSPLE
ncbi:MAG: hypothetical protein J5374_07280 [Bacteroidales bacterium]|nr:hypothetical protein [Bacteroidales bacterium]